MGHSSLFSISFYTNVYTSCSRMRSSKRGSGVKVDSLNTVRCYHFNPLTVCFKRREYPFCLLLLVLHMFSVNQGSHLPPSGPGQLPRGDDPESRYEVGWGCLPSFQPITRTLFISKKLGSLMELEVVSGRLFSTALPRSKRQPQTITTNRHFRWLI